MCASSFFGRRDSSLNSHLHEKKEIMNKVMKEMIKKRTDEQIAGIVAIKGLLIETEELLDKYPVDLKAVKKKLKQIEAVRSEMEFTLIKGGEENKSILTSDQRKRFKTM